MTCDGCGSGTDAQLLPFQRRVTATATPPNGLVLPQPTAHASVGPVASTASRKSSGVMAGVVNVRHAPELLR